MPKPKFEVDQILWIPPLMSTGTEAAPIRVTFAGRKWVHFEYSDSQGRFFRDGGKTKSYGRFDRRTLQIDRSEWPGAWFGQVYFGKDDWREHDEYHRGLKSLCLLFCFPSNPAEWLTVEHIREIRAVLDRARQEYRAVNRDD